MNKRLIKFKNSRNLFFAIVSIVIVTTIAITVIFLSRQYILQQAELRIRDVMLEAESLHEYVQRDMHPAMYQLKLEGRMPQNFYSPEILSSSYITRHVFHHFNKKLRAENLPEVEYKMASKNPRNKINQADSLEAELIDLFNKDSTIRKYTGIVEEQGIKYLYYAKPFFPIEKRCLKCHGKREEAPYELRTYYKWDSGFDLKVGVIPAIEVMKTPLVGEFKTSTTIMVAILITAIILLTFIILYSNVSVKNSIIRSQKDEIEKTLNKLKSTQAQLVQSEKMASLGILTAGVAHEINNPLNFIIGGHAGIDSYFKKNPDKSDKQVSTMLKNIEEGVNRTAGIVKRLNQFSKNNQKYDEVCNIHYIVDNCLLMQRNKLEHRIKINKEYANAPAIIIANVGKLHQVFINILSNAIDAIEEEGQITIRTVTEEDFLHIEISDTGNGIKKEHLKKITDPFFTTKAPGKGTGLGLSITYNIIKDLKGELNFVSEPGKGTTVKIKLPLKH